eukprot:5998357-Ditylum_brightwellii.AAC.1
MCGAGRSVAGAPPRDFVGKGCGSGAPLCGWALLEQNINTIKLFKHIHQNADFYSSIDSP